MSAGDAGPGSRQESREPEPGDEPVAAGQNAQLAQDPGPAGEGQNGRRPQDWGRGGEGQSGPPPQSSRPEGEWRTEPLPQDRGPGPDAPADAPHPRNREPGGEVGAVPIQDRRARQDGRSKFQNLRVLLAWLDILKAWLTFMAELAALLGARRSRERPWRVKIARRRQGIALSDKEVERLLQRQKDLKDLERLSDAAQRFKVPESDFFADPAQMERLIRRILQENPPWLYVSKRLAGSDGAGASSDQEVLWREQETFESHEVTLFLPDENWRDLPLASMTMRPVKHLGEVWQARLLDQVLPPEVLLDRMNRGEVLIPVRNNRRQRLEFLSERRWMEVPVRKRLPVAIEMEGGAGQGGQLLYVLLDSSASMRGTSATVALAAISAALRANLSQRGSRYLFRRYAEQEAIWPSAVEPPVQARTIEEKDALLDLICATNFNGGATHVNHALDVAVSDVQNLRREERLEAEILLVTDGRAEMLESTGLRLREAGVKLHTVMVAPQPNPSLAAISESFTVLDIGPDIAPHPAGSPESPSVAAARPRRTAYRI